MSRNTKTPIQVLTILAGGALAQYRAVTSAGAYPAAGKQAFGMTLEAVDASGDAMAVGTDGQFTATAGAAFLVDANLAVGTDGKLVTAVATNHIVAVALEAATADGDEVEVKLAYRGLEV